MDFDFTEKNLDLKAKIKQDAGKNQFLFENNFKQMEEIYRFLTSKDKLLMVSGFTGTGKNTIVNKVFEYLNPETIVLDYTSFETTILDDVLLSFFDDFKKLISQGIIGQPKTKSENFTQKISAYFQSMDKPVIIRINSWQNILKDAKDEILNFLVHISHYENVKIILISRKFNIEDFEGKFAYKKISVLALEKNLFEKYLKSEDIKLIGPISDELYRYTKGYYFYTTLAIKIMKLKNIPLIDFIAGYTRSMLSFGDFILREALALVDPVSGHLFRFLTIIRHPVSLELIYALNLYNEEKIIYFIENLLIAKIGNSIYLPECYKEIAQNAIPDNILIKIHKACSELYKTQLPLKPLERNMMISRTTMRNEIEYHNMFVPQKPKMVEQKNIAGVKFSTPVKEDKTQANQPEAVEDKKNVYQVSFIFDQGDYSALDNIADSIENFVKNSHKNLLNEDEIKGLSLRQIVNLIQKEENNFNYKKAAALCQKCLTMKKDDDFYSFLPTIYKKLAGSYTKLSQWFEALKYFELALEFYESSGDILKAAEIKYEMAEIYYATFKHDKAKNLLTDILNTEDISNNLRIKAYLELADIEKNSGSKKSPLEYYNIALYFVDAQTEKVVLSELYYKLGVIYDEKGEIKKAVDFYKKCVKVDNNFKNNPYLSSALSNISNICDENGQTALAIKYCFESLEIDESAKNLNGIYISSSKLASLYRKSDFEKSVSYYKKAISAANELNEPFYIAQSNLALGDYFSNKKHIKQAYECYKLALDIAVKHFKPDNIAKIEMRINDIKLRVGETEFEKLKAEIK